MHRPLPAQPSCLLFDLDGTFADTAPDMARALNQLRAEKGLPPLPTAALRPYVSHGSRGMLGAGLNMMPDHPEYAAHVAQFLARYEQDICLETLVFSGVWGIVDYVEQRHIPWGIVTNKIARFTLPLMKQLDPTSRANIIVCGDTCAKAKPHPDPLLHAAAQLGADPAQGIYLGDDLRDIQAAHAAGMTAIAVRYGYLGDGEPIENWQADYIIDQPHELITLLEKMSVATQ